MVMPQRKPTPWLVDLLARLADYRRAPPLPGLLSEEIWRLPVRKAERDAGNQGSIVLAQAGGAPEVADADDVLIDEAARPARDRLDPDEPRFLRSGPVVSDDHAILARDAMMSELHRVGNRWPHLNVEKDRRKSILDNTPSLFDVVENPNASARAPVHALHEQGYRAIRRNDKTIEEEASRVGLDPDLARAVMYVENAQGWYGWPFDLVGFSRTLFPMNVNPTRWGALGGSTGSLQDDRENIRAGVTLLKRIEDRFEKPTVEKIAALYNNGAADFVNDYGARVAEVLRRRLWTVCPYHMPAPRTGVRRSQAEFHPDCLPLSDTAP